VAVGYPLLSWRSSSLSELLWTVEMRVNDEVGGGRNCAKTTDRDPWYEVWNLPCHCAAGTYEGEERMRG
jgi:hypothetical protein